MKKLSLFFLSGLMANFLLLEFFSMLFTNLKLSHDNMVFSVAIYLSLLVVFSSVGIGYILYIAMSKYKEVYEQNKIS